MSCPPDCTYCYNPWYGIITVMKTKTCNKCQEEKPLSEFHKDNGNPDGYRYSCKKCWMAAHYNTEKSRAGMRKWRAENPLKRLLLRRRRRIDAIQKLGGKCECCNETRLEFLAIDHITPIHRKKLNESSRHSGDALIEQVRQSGFSKEKFRVLCHNCNSAIGWYGYCPHQNPEKDFLTRQQQQA